MRLTPLVGRERELDEIAGALGRTRLITLTGPGGAGKTRLALAAAQAAEADFPAGARWVSLAQIEDPGLVGQAIASQLGVPDTPGQEPAVAIAKHLAGHRVLVVLDNCEHLAGAAADLAEYLLAACPALIVLATSRAALGVEGELSWQVPPLSLPPSPPGAAATGAMPVMLPVGGTGTGGTAADGTGTGGTGPGLARAARALAAPSAAALAGFDAVRLFEQRAQLVRPSFLVTDENAAAVLAICRRLDGLPLAIELAAARMRIMSAAQLAERMDDVFAVLVGGARSAPPRHQALRAALDWSYDLLGEDERAVFRYLSVFAGGFTLPAAERVAATGDIRPSAMLELLTRLADKSLLRVEHGRGGTRYSLLATIRDYARDRLVEAGENDQVRRAHLEYFTELVEEAAARTDQAAELDRLDAELPNLRRAFEFALGAGQPVAALRIAAPLDRYAYLRGHYHEIRQWLDAAVTAGEGAPAALRAQALLGGGRLALLQCDYAPAVRRLEAALRLYRELGDPRGIAGSLQVLGSVAREQGRYARAADLHAESLAVAEAAGDRWAAASAHGYLAFACWLQRDYAQATAEAGIALAEFRALGDAEGTAWSLISLGTVARYQGDAERAAALLAESMALAEGIGFREGIAWSAEQLGLLAATDGDPAAIGLLRRSFELHEELRDRWRMASVLEDLAAVALAQDDLPRAARLLGAAEALRDAIGTIIAPCERLQHNQVTRALRTALGDDAFDHALRQGQLASPDELIADLPAAESPPPEPKAPATKKKESRARPAPPESVPPAAAGTFRIRALGAAAVEIDGTALTAADWSYAKPRELMFLLVSSPPMTKEQIAAALWPELARPQLGNALHTALRELRRALGDPGWVRYADGHYRFDRSRPHECDVTAFEDALVAARRARPAEAALPELQRAIAAYGGDFLAGMATGEWALIRRDELRRAFESALLAAGRLHAAAGRHQAAVTAFRRAVAHEPLNESAHRELMSSWAALGETARAVRHYEELTALLRDQVGVAPAAETEALHRRLTGQR